MQKLSISNSAHHCMVAPKTAPIEGRSAYSARELKEYKDVQGDTKLEDWFCGDEELEEGCEVCQECRGRLDPSCEKDEAEEC